MIRIAIIALAFLFAATAYSQGTAFLQDSVTAKNFNTDKFPVLREPRFCRING